MSRTRKPIKAQLRPSGFYARFFHPITQKAVRIFLGTGSAAEDNLRELNSIFMNPDAWEAPPATVSQFIRDEWLKYSLGSRRIPLKGSRSSALAEQSLAKALKERDKQLEDALARIKILTRQLEQALNRKVRTTPFPTLEKARSDWVEKYQGRDDRHMKNVGYMLNRFVKDFKGTTVVDQLEGREGDIDAWLRSLKKEDGKPVSAGVRHQYRRYVLKFLTDSGLHFDRKAIATPKRHEIRRDRGGIEWLTKEQAETVADALEPYYADAWRLQVALGLRPNEIITIKISDLRGDMLTLSALGNLSLKTGPRTIQLPAKTLAILKRRLKESDYAFPYRNDYRTEKSEELKPWPNERRFELQYRKRLQKVPGMPFKLDCRTGRRTCGSILIRSGHSVEEVAKLLGDRADTVREHYAAILSAEVKPEATAI